jgi:superfamily I DNA/RNA helicase
LSDAISLLHVRSQLRQRFKTSADRALANVDVFLEMARAYDVRGLRAFARDMRGNWEEAVRQVEGRPDVEEQSVALITIHAAKGLEWPIVIPINMTGVPKADSGLMHDRRSRRFSVPVLGVEPPNYTAISNWNAAELARERVRLWYVAATRARDLLILPRHSSGLVESAWARLVDFDLGSLPSIEAELLGKLMPASPGPLENVQSSSRFAEEAAFTVQAHRKIEWRQPRQPRTAKASVIDFVRDDSLTSVHERATRQRRDVSPSLRSAILPLLMIGDANAITRKRHRSIREDRRMNTGSQHGIPQRFEDAIGHALDLTTSDADRDKRALNRPLRLASGMCFTRLALLLMPVRMRRFGYDWRNLVRRFLSTKLNRQ